MKKRFFDLAEKISIRSSHKQHFIGACIVKKNRIISLGYNQLKTHPKSPSKFKSLHAETHALLGIPLEQLRGASIYVFRKTRNNTLGNSKPCRDCESLLRAVGIKNVFYCLPSGYAQEVYA